MWTLASSLSSQFQVAGRQFYAETRQLLHALESEEPGHQISIEQAQAWTLLAIYELTCEDYHRGMMTAGRAFRLIQIMRLYELDIPPPSPPPKQARLSPHGQVQEDWIDLETKRRTFWLAYTLDRFTSMVDGLHLFFDERRVGYLEWYFLNFRCLYLLAADPHALAGSQGQLRQWSSHGDELSSRYDSGHRPRLARNGAVVPQRDRHRGDDLRTGPRTQTETSLENPRFHCNHL